MSIFDLFSSDIGTQAAAAAKQASNKAARKGYNAQADALKSGMATATNYQKQALPQWQTIFGQGTAMQPYYMGALGIGSPGQIQGAQNAFMSSIPGQQYQAQLPDIYEAALRRGGLTGQTGQIPIDLTNETMKSLNQFYPGWQSALNPLPYETAGATGEANIYNNLSNIATGTATNLANAAANKYSTMGTANAAYPQNVAAAKYGAAGNQLSALFGVANLAGQFFGSPAMPTWSNMFGSGSAQPSTSAPYPDLWNTTVNYG